VSVQVQFSSATKKIVVETAEGCRGVSTHCKPGSDHEQPASELAVLFG
jgi:hypothetical protein